MGLFKLSALSAAAGAIAVTTLMPETVDAHAFLLLPKAEFTIKEKNFYAYVVPGEKVPPFSSYTTGNAERNSQGFTANYKKLNPPNLRDFILKNQEYTKDSSIPKTGTAECGFSKPNIAPQPLPDHVEFGNYNLQISGGLHPGPCEAWCDDEIVIPFTEDCRTRFQKPIAYDKAKCQGKGRFTFYWLATHFAPFQVYVGCVPLQGAKPGNTSSNTGGDADTKKPVVTPTTIPSAAPSSAPSKAPAPAPVPAPAPAPTSASPAKCSRLRD
ncbi:hypothetical protein Poli38472_000437 [Pythium oligandrum]|uniref:Uncharacterized protein n=1 Tax=Pythium oligandrum TaxID=41045 RepID=A0A8K1CCP8_PYTOL|nr:hypothetical protein Poli38472_000437 [Pythium oligandrum]|eukprot:TMW60395.1 hypothetical protein Poli38472_000437 [Pythium oligandrum]